MTLFQGLGQSIRGETIYYAAGYIDPGHPDGLRLRGKLGNSVDAQVLPNVQRSTTGASVAAPDAIRCHEARYEANETRLVPGKGHTGRHTIVRGYLIGDATCRITKQHPGAARA